MEFKEQFISEVQHLNRVIDEISEENCYNKIVEFFRVSSYLNDYYEEILELPLKDVSKSDKNSEHYLELELARKRFLGELSSAGRCLYGHNRTHPGERVTKDKLFFGNTDGYPWFPVNIAERMGGHAEFQATIRRQMTGFVNNFKNCFKTDWVG